jgi:hypothetical protein
MKLLFSLFVVCLFVSCQNKSAFSSELNQVDSLYTEVLSLESKLKEVDSNRAQEVYKESNQLETYLSANYPDTLDKDFWVNDMNRIYKVRRGLEKYLSQENVLKEEIKYSKTQLLSLRKSLQDEKLDSMKAEEYLTSELKAVSKIVFLTDKYQPKGLEAIQAWPEVKKDLQSIADSIAEL